MGGKKPSAPTPQPVPEAAKPLDYTKMFGAARKNSRLIGQDQIKQLKSAYPELEKLQLGTINKVAANLSAKKNEYTQRAENQLIAAENQATQIGNIGASTEQLADEAAQTLQGTDIERELQRQSTAELALGRSLSPEQERTATQQARAGYAARGLGAGSGALAAEVLNRDMYASARASDRRNFAGATNQLLVGNQQSRIGMVGNLLGQSANTRMNQANLRSSLAGANIALDPYQRAFAPGASFGQGISGQAGGMLGQAYGNALNTVGNVDTFNVNMLETRRNSALNNNASMQGAYMNAQAQQSAGMMGMFGSLGGGALAAGGMIGGAAIIV